MLKLRCRLRTLLLMSILIMGCAWFPKAMADLNDGLIAYYPFEGNAIDQSGNGNHGIVHGATLTEDRFWSAESAYHFDGKDDYIQVAHNSTLNATPTGFTISTWIKGNLTQQNDLSVIIEKSHSDYEGWVMQSFNTHIGGHSYSPGFSWGMGHEATPDSNDKTPSISGLELLDTQWHYLTAIFDGTTTKLYIDGILRDNKTYPWAPVPNTGSLYIGDWWNGSRNFSGVIDDIRIYNRALSNSEIQQLYTIKPVSGDADLDAAREVGRQACQTNPASCGITITSLGGLSESQLDSAKQTAKQEGKQACIDSPASCNINIASLGGLSQSELDSAKQTAKQEGKQAGKQACTDSPASCGISIESLGGFTQAQLNAKKNEGITNGKQVCIDNPGSCGITISSLGGLSPAQLSVKKDEGIRIGKQTCIDSPGSCGITLALLGGLSQSQVDSAKQTAKQEGKQACIDSPGSCGITITSLGGLSQSQLDSAKQTAKEEGKQVCVNSPTSCGITINSFLEELSAAKQSVKNECKANPASCGIPVNPTRDEVKTECQEDPASCGIDLDSAIEGGFLEFFEAGNGVYDPGDQLKIELMETLDVHRFYRVDLWIIIELPNGGFLYRTDLPLAPYSPNPTPFLGSLETSKKRHQILDYEVPQGIGGDYNLYAFFIREGEDIFSLKTLASNVAKLTITFRNE